MGWYFREPTLWKGETSLHRYRANRATKWRAIGGLLVATDQRLIFEPHHVDGLFGAQTIEMSLRQIDSVEVTPPRRSTSELGIKDRLEVTMRSGHRERFLVKDVQAVVNEIRECLNLSD